MAQQRQKSEISRTWFYGYHHSYAFTFQNFPEKISDHQVRSPLLAGATACQTCHNIDAEALVARVETIQDRTAGLLKLTGGQSADCVGCHPGEAGGVTQP